MAEMLDYAPDLRAITGGQGEYSMDLARYEECPGHVAQQVMQQVEAEKEAVKA
jgi:elongation factor G